MEYATFDRVAGVNYATINGVRGAGVASADPVFDGTLNIMSDTSAANHFAGAAGVGAFWYQEITE